MGFGGMPPKGSKKSIEKKPAAAKKAPGEKRKVGAYIIFTKEMRPKIVKENPGMAFGDVGKALGLAWGKLTDAQKEKVSPQLHLRLRVRCARCDDIILLFVVVLMRQLSFAFLNPSIATRQI